jgi:hypothetical protein
MVMSAAGAVAGAAGALAGAAGLARNAKAKILVADDEPYPPRDTVIECMFNPNSYTLAQSIEVKWNRAPGATEGGTPQYTGRGPATLSMELFFDDFAALEGDVTPKITTLLSWTRPTPASIEAMLPCPPKVRFDWGNPQLQDFSGYIKRVSVNYTVFRKDGTPVQAKVSLTIEGEGERVPGQNPTSHAANSSRARTTIDGDTLQSIAYQELGKASYWRAIAELNGIDDPLRLEAGTVLLIPSAADAARAR